MLFRSLVDASSGGGTLLYVSRLEPDKRVDLLLDAFALVLKRRPKARLVVIGKGTDDDRLRAHAGALGIEDGVRFVGPAYEENALAGWFLAADVFPYPVAIGLSILHAFGYGLPVVTSDDIHSHNPEIDALRDGRNGLLYRDGDTADFADCIERILADEALRTTLSKGARATVEGPDGFTLTRMVDGYVEALRAAAR